MSGPADEGADELDLVEETAGTTDAGGPSGEPPLDVDPADWADQHDEVILDDPDAPRDVGGEP